MKKVIAILLAVGLLLSLNACRRKAPDRPTEAPTEMEFGPFTWPRSDFAKLIPETASHIGNVYWENAHGFVIYVANTNKAAYDAYVDACWEAGFQLDYDKGNDYFYADNQQGYQLRLKLEEDDVMFIRMDAPDEEEATETTEASEETESSEETETEPDETEPSGVDPELKAFWDSYEAFVDEYVTFMNNYSSSDDPVAMLNDLNRYMEKYTDFMEKAAEYDP